MPGITFVDPMAEDQYPLALLRADVLLVNERSSVDDMSLPSKLTSYLVARRPSRRGGAGQRRDGRTASRSPVAVSLFRPRTRQPCWLLSATSCPIHDAARSWGERGNIYAQTTLTRDRGLAATRSFVVDAAGGL